LGELEVAGIFSNKGKDRKRAQSFMVLFDGRAACHKISGIERDQISHLIGRWWIAISNTVFFLLGLSEAHLSLDQ
jgi:hypothetical protein